MESRRRVSPQPPPLPGPSTGRGQRGHQVPGHYFLLSETDESTVWRQVAPFPAWAGKAWRCSSHLPPIPGSMVPLGAGKDRQAWVPLGPALSDFSEAGYPHPSTDGSKGPGAWGSSAALSPSFSVRVFHVLYLIRQTGHRFVHPSIHLVIHSCIHSSNVFLSTYYMLSAVLDSGDAALNKTKTRPLMG